MNASTLVVSKRPAWGLLALALAVPFLFGAMLSGMIPSIGSPLGWLGLAGPMTGSTRAWLALLQGDALAALAWNPLFWFWGFWLMIAYTDLWRWALRTGPMDDGWAYPTFTRLRQHRVIGPLCLVATLVTLVWQNTPLSLVGQAL